MHRLQDNRYDYDRLIDSHCMLIHKIHYLQIKQVVYFNKLNVNDSVRCN